MRFGLLLAGVILLLPQYAAAYSISLAVEQRVYPRFKEYVYSYSSLFRQGRDNFHWLDLSYGSDNYAIKNEIGRASTIGSAYRFARRQRWARNFKPAVFVGAGLYRRNLTERQRTSDDNFILYELSDADKIGFTVNLGGGYLWELKSFVLGFSAAVGYDFNYESRFYKTELLFSYEL